MKNKYLNRYTLEELKNTNDTTMKYILNNPNCTMDDVRVAHKWYLENSKSEKKYNKKFSRFKKHFEMQLEVYKTRINEK